VAADRDVLLYRAYVAQKNYELVVSEAKTATDPGVCAVRTLAQYFASAEGSDARATAVSEAQLWTTEGTAATTGSSMVQIAGGTIFLAEGRVDDALRALHQPLSLDAMALLVQALLAANRIDLADAQVKSMQQVDDDATATQLALAWVALAMGGNDKINEARAIFQELAEKHGVTPLLLQGMAVCAMRLGRWSEAEKLLMDASEKGAARDPELLVNLIVCSLHSKKPADIVNRYVAQLRAAAPAHPWLKQLKDFEAAFETAATKIVPFKQ